MNQTTERRFFPALLGALHQEQAEGELILEQNDGTRRVFWEKGKLVYLQSDAAGEQFGNYLIRQGVLNREALQDLLAAQDTSRFGDRVVQWGLVSAEERDRLLQRLLEQILLNALEHPLVSVIWEPGDIHEKLSSDLRFHLDHRPLIWESFQQIRDLTFLVDLLYSEPDWRWSSREDLLVSLSDLSLTPEIAFALTLTGGEAMGYESFMSVTGMEEDDAARLIVCLWALGSLSLVDGKMPSVPLEKHKASAQGDAGNYSTGQMAFVDPAAPPPAEIGAVQRDIPPPAPPPPIAPAPVPKGIVPDPPPLPDIPISWSLPVPATPPAPQESQPQPPQPMKAPHFERPLHRPAAPAVIPSAELPRQPAAFQPPISRPPPASIWGMLPGQDAPPSTVPPIGSAPIPSIPPPPLLSAPLHSEEAIELCGETDPGISTEPETPLERARRYLKKAKIFLIQGRTGDAVHALEESVRLDPDSKLSFEAWVLLGKLRLSNPAWMNRAVEALQTATRINPLIVEPWVLMGEVFLKKDFKANAVNCYRKAYALDPSIHIPKECGLDDLAPPASGGEGKDGPGLMGRIKGLFS